MVWPAFDFSQHEIPAYNIKGRIKLCAPEMIMGSKFCYGFKCKGICIGLFQSICILDFSSLKI
jgi:hypothetical protein